jgi:hypothetical protein
MFRDSDLDCYDVQPNATCTVCSVDVSRGQSDTSTCCDACSDRRDAHTSMLEHRLVMAKATSRAALVGAPKMTSGELAFCVAVLGLGWPLARAIDRVQAQRNRLPFGKEAA